MFTSGCASYISHFPSINEEREIPGRQKVVRGSNVPVLASHACLNPCSKRASLSHQASLAALRAGYIYSGDNSSKAGKLSILIWYRADTARYHEHEVRVIKIPLNVCHPAFFASCDFPSANPPRLIRFREYIRGFQTPHELSFMPAALGRSGFLTTDTAQTQ